MKEILLRLVSAYEELLRLALHTCTTNEPYDVAYDKGYDVDPSNTIAPPGTTGTTETAAAVPDLPTPKLRPNKRLRPTKREQVSSPLIPQRKYDPYMLSFMQKGKLVINQGVAWPDQKWRPVVAALADGDSISSVAKEFGYAPHVVSGVAHHYRRFVGEAAKLPPGKARFEYFNGVFSVTKPSRNKQPGY